MANAKIDENGQQTATAYLDTDGVTITRIYADPTTHGLAVHDASTGSDNGGNVNTLDENFRPILFAESSAGDGELVALYVDSSGNLLIDSN